MKLCQVRRTLMTSTWLGLVVSVTACGVPSADVDCSETFMFKGTTYRPHTGLKDTIKWEPRSLGTAETLGCG